MFAQQCPSALQERRIRFASHLRHGRQRIIRSLCCCLFHHNIVVPVFVGVIGVGAVALHAEVHAVHPRVDHLLNPAQPIRLHRRLRLAQRGRQILVPPGRKGDHAPMAKSITDGPRRRRVRIVQTDRHSRPTVVEHQSPFAEVRLVAFPDRRPRREHAGDLVTIGIQRRHHVHGGVLKVGRAVLEIRRDHHVPIRQREARQRQHAHRIARRRQPIAVHVIHVPGSRLNGFNHVESTVESLVSIIQFARPHLQMISGHARR